MKRDQKKKIISSVQKHKKDTGSSQVQISILTERIKELTDHLKKHPKDNHSRRGLYLMVGKRRKHLNYLKNSDKEAYKKLVKSLNL